MTPRIGQEREDRVGGLRNGSFDGFDVAAVGHAPQRMLRSEAGGNEDAVMRRMRSMLIVGVALASIAAACSSSGKAATPPTSTTPSTPTTPVTQPPIPAPAGLPAFYSVPQPLPTKAGSLLKLASVPVSGLHGTMYRVMYVSTTMQGKPAAVTGLIAIPNGTPPAGGFPVVSWAHGTDGMADQCAPSLDPSANVALANVLLDHGWVVT